MGNQTTPAWSDGDVVANGIRLHYHRTGGAKPALVLAHGITDNGLCWSRLAFALADQFDLIMVDARGHGLSEKPAGGYSAHDHADDLAGLIQALALKQPAVIGHSMGGTVAAILAATYPDRVSRLVLEDPAWFPQDEVIDEAEEIEYTRAWAEAIVQRQALTVEAIMAQARQDHPSWDAEEYPVFAQAKLQVSPQVTQFNLAPAQPWWEIVPALACPVLLLTGDPARGAAITLEMAQAIGALNPRLQIVRLPAAGHNVRREQFDDYVHHVRHFLGPSP
jgi:pimeloyl-ACP methyl ester carboxylesterase